MKTGWIYLILTILFEVTGTTVMNISGTTGELHYYILMFIFIGLSYYFLSLAVRTISLGVAYAIWEGLGVSLITLVSIFIFDQWLTLQQWLGLGLTVIGIIILNASEMSSKANNYE